MSFRFEVWDPPGIATFERKIAAAPAIQASGTVYRRQTGRGSMTIPGDYSRLDEIINVDPSNHSNDVASTIRVYRYDDWCQDLVVKSSPNLVAGQDATLTLDGIETVLDWAVVEAWDWDGTADFVSEFPDWVYGGRNLLVDPSLSESVCEPRISEFWTDATSGQWRVNVDGDTVDIDYNATASQVTTAFESLSTVTDVRVEGNGSSDTPWRVTFVEPCFPATTYTVTTNTLNAPINAALIQLGSEQAPGWTEAQPLFGNSLYGVYDEFEVATLPAATPAGTTEGIKFDAQAPVGFSFPGAQSVPAVTPGALVQGGVWVYVDAAGSYPMRLVLRTPSEEPLIADSGWPSTSVTGQTWTLLSFADATIPDWIDRAIFRVSYVGSANPPDIYIADAYLREGMSENTVGFIMGELLDDAQTDHAASAFPRATITFINKTFTDTLDSAGNAWDSDVFVSIPRGMTYRKVLERIFGQLGYEWNLTPTSGTPGEWDLNIWNPDGRGTDYSSADTPSILFGQGTVSGSATRTLPPGNIVISEGAGYYTSRAANSASYGTIGRREWWQTDISYQQTQVDDWTDRQLARFLDETLNPRFEIADPPAGSSRPVPLIDFGLADTMNVDLTTGGGKVSRAVEAISWRTVDDGVMFGVQLGDTQFDNIGGFSGGGSASSGVDMAAMGPVNEGVRRLIDAFKRQQFQPAASAFVPGGAGGAPTVVVAAFDATDLSKQKADFVCKGSNDEETINQAIRSATDMALGASNTRGGRVLLTEGSFYVDASSFFCIVCNPVSQVSLHLQGMGIFSTHIRQQAGVGATVSSIITAAGAITISDLSVEPLYNSPNVVGINADTMIYGNINRVLVTSAGSHGIVLDTCDYTTVTNCIVESNGGDGFNIVGGNDVSVSDCAAFDMDGNGIASIFSTNLTLRDNYIEDTGEHGIDLDQDGFVIVEGNQFRRTGGSSIHAYGVSYGSIAKNLVTTANQQGTASAGIYYDGTDISGDPGVNIEGNHVENTAGTVPSILVENTEAAVVRGNIVEEPTGHGVALNATDHSNVYGNLIRNYSGGTDNTYDGVNVTASDFNYFHGNHIRQLDQAGNVFRYAFNVASGECNIVVGNDLGDVNDYGTDALGDTGSNTRLTYPADATYGDNFTDCGSGS